MALLNVRLDGQDEKKVTALRESGVVISALVRNAIRSEYDRRVGALNSDKVRSKVVLATLAAFPDPENLPDQRVDALDRKMLRQHVQAKLRRK